ncbi:uncharacterized protein LOC124164018 [Ischnura elegans]|uniref:uncharacterized protein LOC124164018 n=1 Tax=Ischnura elegans TaxID=197161 RepID=UPI001ED8A53B|nr:uncharacterized protein LOC124164018 [Ischnura elegans]
MRLIVNISSRVKCIKITFNDTLDMKLGEERLSIHKVLEPKEGEALRFIYSLPSPLTERSEINMSISPSHWLIEKISVIPASGEESTQEAVTSQYSRAGEGIGIACGVIILLIAVIAVVIKKCRCKNRSLGSSDTQTADNRRVDTVDAGTKEACVEKAPERDVSHEIVELEEKGFDKSTNNEAILASANTKAHLQFTSDASTSHVTIPSCDENSYEEENLIYGEF